MKRIIAIILLFFLPLVAFPKSLVKIGPYAGYFAPRSETLDQLYDGKDFLYGAKLGVRVWNEFYVFLSATQYKKDGATTELDESTQLTLTPLTLSLRYTFSLGTFNPYLGGGITQISYKERADIGDVKGKGNGYALEAGFELKLSQRLRLDLGITYSDATDNPTGFDVQLGGIQAGIAFFLVF
ncbi:MAG: porin family protein [bacterium]|nr:porin family protein [bacterium]